MDFQKSIRAMHRLGEPKLYVPEIYFEPIDVEFPGSDIINNQSNSPINQSNNDTANEFTNVSVSAGVQEQTVNVSADNEVARVHDNVNQDTVNEFTNVSASTEETDVSNVPANNEVSRVNDNVNQDIVNEFTNMSPRTSSVDTNMSTSTSTQRHASVSVASVDRPSDNVGNQNRTPGWGRSLEETAQFGTPGWGRVHSDSQYQRTIF